MPTKYILSKKKTFKIKDVSINWIPNQKILNQTCFLHVLKIKWKILGTKMVQGTKCQEQGKVFKKCFLQYWLDSVNISDYLAWDKLAREPGLQEKCWWGEFEAKQAAWYCDHYSSHKEHLGVTQLPAFIFVFLFLFVLFCQHSVDGSNLL